jgi:hypothetical protein
MAISGLSCFCPPGHRIIPSLSPLCSLVHGCYRDTEVADCYRHIPQDTLLIIMKHTPTCLADLGYTLMFIFGSLGHFFEFPHSKLLRFEHRVRTTTTMVDVWYISKGAACPDLGSLSPLILPMLKCSRTSQWSHITCCQYYQMQVYVAY